MLATLKTKDLLLSDTLNLGIVRWSEKKPDEAIEIYERARVNFETSPDLLLQAKFHNNLAIIFKQKAEISGDTTYYDKAISEYRLAQDSLSGLEDFAAVANVEINIASLYYNLKKYKEAHAYLDRGEEALELFHEDTILGQALETRARCFYAQADYRKAAIAINKSEALLLDGLELDPLVETLKTKRMIHMALEAQVCLEYANASIAGERFGITSHAVRKKIKEYFG